MSIGASRCQNGDISGSAADRQVAATLSPWPAGAAWRALVTDAWSANSAQAQVNVRHIFEPIAQVLVKIELLLDRTAAEPA